MKRREERVFACLARQTYGHPCDWDMQVIALADVRRLIADLEWRKVNAEEACRQIFENTRAFHYHYLAVQTLRELGRAQKLSRRGAQVLLESTAYTKAYYAGTENGHTLEENVAAVLTTKANVSVVARYVQTCLLEHREFRDWRWQAFRAISKIVECCGSQAVSIGLKRALRIEVENEENQLRKEQFKEVLENKLHA